MADKKNSRRKHLDSGYARPDLNFDGGMQRSMCAQGMSEAKTAIAKSEEADAEKAAAEPPKQHSNVEASNMAHTASQTPTNTTQPTLIEEEVEETELIPHTEEGVDGVDEFSD